MTEPRRSSREQVRLERKAEKRGRAAERAAFTRDLVEGVDFAALSAALDSQADAPAGGRRRGPRAAPVAQEQRWVPVGPSAVIKGQAIDRPRVSGRIRDVWADATGQRAYAASAMGGVWYTDDGGATWSPFGSWATQQRVKGGAANGLSMGCLLVHFGATQADDVVLAGTGELQPWESTTGSGYLGGIGVLASFAHRPDPAQPWEPDTGVDLMEGLGIFRLARRPTGTPDEIHDADTAPPDVVLAATSKGAYLGTRSNLPLRAAAPGLPALPARKGYAWRKLDLDWASDSPLSDAAWLSDTRVILLVHGYGPVYCNVDFATPGDFATLRFSRPTDLPLASPAGSLVTITGRMSMAAVPGNPDFLYILGADADKKDQPTIWRSTNATAAAPVMAVVEGAPAKLWGTQRDYDQCIAVDRVAVEGVPTDRVYLGGSFYDFGDQYGAGLYCFDVKVTPKLKLVPAPLVSTTGWGEKGAGAHTPGVIGNNVHADVHNIFLTGSPGASRQVWVACDGGVFVSDRAGRPLSFAACNNGMATLQPVFVRAHPVNGHVLAAGFQDNGTLRRLGDTVWEAISLGDGGGVAWAPLAPNVLVHQYHDAAWLGQPSSSFNDPVSHTPGGTTDKAVLGTDHKHASFYSGAATVLSSDAKTGRLAIGTYRVFVSDDVKDGKWNTWKTLQLPLPVPPPPSGQPKKPWLPSGDVVTLAWASTTQLFALFAQVIAQYTQGNDKKWTVTKWARGTAGTPMAAGSRFTDLAVVPTTGPGHGEIGDFYVATTGIQDSPEETLWWHGHASGFHATAFRHRLDPAAGTLGPRDPVFAVTVDPAQGDTVYVGTATGVWRGLRKDDAGTHDWTHLDNGLPEAMVQDLHIWWDGKADSPRLLRAAVQSRGVWELDISAPLPAAPAGPPRGRTWIRAHAWDDRRRTVATDVNPLVRSSKPETLFASPDIVVRPKWPVAAPPRFPLTGAKVLTKAHTYDIWTFQTAFRCRYPSVVADGVLSDSLKAMIRFHRKKDNSSINKALWDEIVGTRVDAGGMPTDVGGDLAVYRAPWLTPRARQAAPTEVDFYELVVPPSKAGPMWRTYRELSTVDVLIHHRDSLPLAPGEAYATLLWREFPNATTHPTLAATDLVAFFRGVAKNTPPATPAGWHLVANATGGPRHLLSTSLDARLPRGVSIDVDLSTAQLDAKSTHVLLLAFVNHAAEQTLKDPAIDPPATVADLVSSWTYCAARVVELVKRP